ncbi:MAG: 2-amino-4-hydroxy-6-hydroxymethyldihydropteridine diphosphokinase [Gemmatimonadota bacterium]|nr:2-amino-4-hydroxy-6-hydroxymethyldihydropteridine diphosphokinase [Gemmatimonadota bacterium]
MRDTVFIALGGNLGDRMAYLGAARAAITLIKDVTMLAASSVEETAPIGNSVQGAYINQMVAVSTTLPPNVLLAELQRIERTLGRVRGRRWGARTIDLDIVSFGVVRSSEKSLELPHPGLTARAFWQRELAELQAILAA